MAGPLIVVSKFRIKEGNSRTSFSTTRRFWKVVTAKRAPPPESALARVSGNALKARSP